MKALARAAAKGRRFLLAAAVIVWLIADRAARDVVLVAAAIAVTGTVMWVTFLVVKAKHPKEDEGDIP